MKTLLVVLLFFVPISYSFAQNGTLLFTTKKDCGVKIDGSIYKKILGNKPEKLELSAGEHLVHINSLSDSINYDSSFIVEIEQDKQKIIIFNFHEKLSRNFNTTANEFVLTDFEVITDGSLSSNEQYITYPGFKDDRSQNKPVYYFAFNKGDQIKIDIEMFNKKGTNYLYVSTYPVNQVVYSNKQFKELKDLIINVPEKSIYRFAFGSNSLIGRNLRIRITRIAADSKPFTTSVIWQDTFYPQQIHSPQEFYLNSQTNVTTGVTKTTIPVYLPKNTVEWYYTFVATRDKNKHTFQDMSLLGDIASLLLGVNGKIIKFGLNQLKTIPGDDFCNIYILDRNNRDSFANNLGFNYFLEGSRRNFKSSVVKITGLPSDEYYIGVSNPDLTNGIMVSLEVVAIIKDGYYKVSDN